LRLFVFYSALRVHLPRGRRAGVAAAGRGVPSLPHCSVSPVCHFRHASSTNRRPPAAARRSRSHGRRFAIFTMVLLGTAGHRAPEPVTVVGGTVTTAAPAAGRQPPRARAAAMVAGLSFSPWFF